MKKSKDKELKKAVISANKPSIKAMMQFKVKLYELSESNKRQHA